MSGQEPYDKLMNSAQERPWVAAETTHNCPLPQGGTLDRWTQCSVCRQWWRYERGGSPTVAGKDGWVRREHPETAPLPDIQELETRHYIGLMSSGAHMTIKAGPGHPDQFPANSTAPILIGDTLTYPVSAEIAAEWTAGDDEDLDDETLDAAMFGIPDDSAMTTSVHDYSLMDDDD